MTNKTKPESCKTESCQYDSATRTRFYNGMLLTAEHLRDEQTYHREALKRVNRNLFGSGIVCGLEVEIQPRGLCIKIHPGAALDCCGNLIEVCKCITVDLSKECRDRYGSDCISPPDQNPDQFTITKYLVLRYAEKPTDPEQVFTPSGECTPADERPNCEASKVREGFCIELWDECPCPETQTAPDTSLLQTLRESGRMKATQSAMPLSQGGGNPQTAATTTRAAMNQPQLAINPQQSGQQINPPQLSDGRKDCIDWPMPCSDCGCCENTNAVGLAELKINCAENTVQIVNCSCRRYVLSPRLLNWLFSQFPLRQYIPAQAKDVHTKLGYLPLAQLAVAAVGFEDHGDRIEVHDGRLDALDKTVEDLRKRLRVKQASKQSRKLSSKKSPTPPDDPTVETMR